MKPNRNFIVLVDQYRRPSRKRNTAGRYRVGAKDAKEAQRLVREKIGFGSAQVYYESKDVTVPYGQVMMEINFHEGAFDLVPARHANDPLPR